MLHVAKTDMDTSCKPESGVDVAVCNPEHPCTLFSSGSWLCLPESQSLFQAQKSPLKLSCLMLPWNFPECMYSWEVFQESMKSISGNSMC